MTINEALALLYVQKEAAAVDDPGDLLVLFREVLGEINARENALYEARHQAVRLRDNARDENRLQ